MNTQHGPSRSSIFTLYLDDSLHRSNFVPLIESEIFTRGKHHPVDQYQLSWFRHWLPKVTFRVDRRELCHVFGRLVSASLALLSLFWRSRREWETNLHGGSAEQRRNNAKASTNSNRRENRKDRTNKNRAKITCAVKLEVLATASTTVQVRSTIIIRCG